LAPPSAEPAPEPAPGPAPERAPEPAPGFFGPQGRILRLPTALPDLNGSLETFSYKGLRVTNFEMETAAILGLSEIFGFKAISVNAILANRINHTFSLNPNKIIENAIVYTLDSIF
jgi:uridine phosphorylase